MKTLSLKSKTIIAVVLFLVIFAILVAVASIFDFEISEILTQNSLADGAYHATDFFGVVGEIIGSTPIYFFALFACAVLFWCSLKLLDKKPFNVILAVVFAIGAVVAAWFIFKDTFKYVFIHTNKVSEYTYLELFDDFRHSAPIVCVEVLLAIATSALAILATKNFKNETLKKLFVLVIAGVIAAAISNLLIMIVKTPVGRMRFRAINSTLGQGLIANGEVGYTPWYIVNKQPNEAILTGFEETYGVTDAFKSFPSGHTCAAGTTYVLLLVPSLFNFKQKNNKVGKVLCYLVPFVYTGLISISRIVVGAHYMSDVTFGGTIAFLCYIIVKEIFVDKGAHFFALFPKARKKALTPEGVEVGIVDEQAEPAQDESVVVNVESEQADSAIEQKDEDSAQIVGDDNKQVEKIEAVDALKSIEE